MRRAAGVMVFAGLFSEGIIESGIEVEHVIEDGDFGVGTARLNRPTIQYHTRKPTWPIAQLKEMDLDLLYGNPACAGFSMASRNRGLDSEMNDGLKAANWLGLQVQPMAFVVESVTQLFLTGDPLVRGWEAAWQDMGYNTCRLWENSGHLGLPQERKRALFVAAKANLDFSYPQELSATSVRDAIGDLASVESVPIPQYEGRSVPYGLAPDSWYQARAREQNPELYDHAHQVCSPAAQSLLPYLEPGKRIRSISNEIYEQTYWKVAKHHTRGKPSFLNARLHWDTPCAVVTGGATYFHPEQDRFISLRETARIMGLRDSFRVSQARKGYAELGKAVSPFVGKWFGDQIQKILDDPKGRVHQPEVRLL